MSFQDDTTFGFNRSDAKELVRDIGTKHKNNPRTTLPGVRFYVCRLTSSWSSGAASASLFTIDGATITDTGNDVTIYDPLAIFSSLATDDYLWCFLQAGKYYAAQAPCAS